MKQRSDTGGDRGECDGEAYLEPVCLHGVISKAVPEKANHIKTNEYVRLGHRGQQMAK